MAAQNGRRQRELRNGCCAEVQSGNVHHAGHHIHRRWLKRSPRVGRGHRVPVAARFHDEGVLSVGIGAGDISRRAVKFDLNPA